VAVVSARTLIVEKSVRNEFVFADENRDLFVAVRVATAGEADAEDGDSEQAVRTLDEFTREALLKLQIEERTRVTLFDRVGKRLTDLAAVLRESDVYLVTGDEIFFYPGIRAGHLENLTIGGSTYLMRTVSMRPRVFVIEGLLTDYECDKVLPQC
jgi:hypothetical protein